MQFDICQKDLSHIIYIDKSTPKFRNVAVVLSIMEQSIDETDSSGIVSKNGLFFGMSEQILHDFVLTATVSTVILSVE